MNIRPPETRLFADPTKRKRYLFALTMILLMVAVAELSGEKEIIFPEMAALTIGMWIVDKQVWRVSRTRMVALMTAGAVAGVCIVRYSPLPLIADIAVSFAFTAVCLMLFRASLPPLISAGMLPILLGTDSWIYPAAVLTMTLTVAAGQRLMERGRRRTAADFTPAATEWKKETLRWLFLLSTILVVAAVPVYTSNLYFILPPLIVTYVEFAGSKAGFRNRPVQIFLLLTAAAFLGTLFQWAGHVRMQWPEWAVALAVFTSLFLLFERIGKFFAPAGAVALIPMIVPQEDLPLLPFEIAAGAALFIAAAMLLFQQCYRWQRAQLIVCLVPVPLRKHLNRDGRRMRKAVRKF